MKHGCKIREENNDRNKNTILYLSWMRTMCDQGRSLGKGRCGKIKRCVCTSVTKVRGRSSKTFCEWLVNECVKYIRECPADKPQTMMKIMINAHTCTTVYNYSYWLLRSLNSHRQHLLYNDFLIKNQIKQINI